MAGLIRYALLDQQPLRATRTPPLDRAQAAQIIAQLGPIACALRQAVAQGNPEQLSAVIEAAQRDLAEMRTLLLSALGHDV